MKKVLFISTKEMYIVSDKIRGACFEEKKGSAVRLYKHADDNDDDDDSLGWISVSSVDEAEWFIRNIFVNMDSDKDLIIDYINKAVIDANGSDVEKIVASPVRSIEPTPPSKLERMTANAIHGLGLKEE